MTRRAEPVQPAPVQPMPGRDTRARMMLVAIALSGLGAVLAVIALPIFLLVYGGLMPAATAFVMDDRPGRHLSITVASFNGAGLMAGLGPMFSVTFSNAMAYQIVSTPTTWLFVYGFALAGWVLAWIVPLFISQSLDLVDRQRCRTIEQARAAILKQWPSIATGSRRGPYEGTQPTTKSEGGGTAAKSRSTSA